MSGLSSNPNAINGFDPGSNTNNHLNEMISRREDGEVSTANLVTTESNRNPGAKFVASLQIIHTTHLHNSAYDQDCPICHEPYEPTNPAVPKNPVQLTCCGRAFHRECLLEWLSGSGNNTCPMCREKLFPKVRLDDDDDDDGEINGEALFLAFALQEEEEEEELEWDLEDGESDNNDGEGEGEVDEELEVGSSGGYDEDDDELELRNPEIYEPGPTAPTDQHH